MHQACHLPSSLLGLDVLSVAEERYCGISPAARACQKCDIGEVSYRLGLVRGDTTLHKHRVALVAWRGGPVQFSLGSGSCPGPGPGPGKDCLPPSTPRQQRLLRMVDDLAWAMNLSVLTLLESVAAGETDQLLATLDARAP